MENQFSLRPANTEDLPKIMQIETRVQSAPWTQASFQAELTKPYSQFLVMTDDETDSEVAGYMVFWLMFDECQILNLAVDLPFRGLGFAKAMIRKALMLSSQRGIKKVTLEVRKANQPAIQLYQAVGFAITHIRKGFYTDGEDAYQMSLPLGVEPIRF